MAMAFLPHRALDAYRYALSAYQPFIQGDHWFVDSFNPERHFTAPTEFGIGMGAALMGLWNSLVYNNPEFEGYLSTWELMGDSDTALRGMLRVGFDEDVETIERLSGDSISNYDNQKFQTYKAELEAATVESISGIVHNWLRQQGLTNPDYNAMAQAIKDLMETQTVTGLEVNDVEIYADTERNVELFKMLRQVREAQIKASITEISQTVSSDISGKRGSDFIELDEESFVSLLLKTGRTDGDYKQIAQQLQTLADNGDETAKYYLALTHIYRMENLRKAMAYPDERAIYGYQYYLKVEEEKNPYQEAVKLLTEVANSTSDQELKIKALTYKFVALRRNLLDYEGIKQTFKHLNAAGAEGNEFVHKTLTEFFGEEILTILYKQGEISERALTQYIQTKDLSAWEDKINEYIDFCLEYSDPSGVTTAEEFADSEYVLNELSLLPYREAALRQNMVVNLYNPTQAGKIGFYITQMVLEGTSPEVVKEFLETMYEWKPVVKEILGRDLDLWNSQEDVNYLSYVVTLVLQKDENGDNIFTPQEVAQILLQEHGKTMDVGSLLSKLRAPDIPAYQEAQAHQARLVRYLTPGASGVADELQEMVKEGIGITDDADTNQMLEFLQDLFVTSEINFNLLLESIDALSHLETVNLQNNQWFRIDPDNEWECDQWTGVSKIFDGRLLRFKDGYLFTDTRDPQNRAWAKQLFDLMTIGNALGYDINPGGIPGDVIFTELNPYQKLALATWYLLKKTTDVPELKLLLQHIPQEIKDDPEKMALLPLYLMAVSKEDLVSGDFEIPVINIPQEFSREEIFTILHQNFGIEQPWFDVIYEQNDFGQDRIQNLFAYARLLMQANNVKRIEDNFTQLASDSPALQEFLKEYVLGEDFDSANLEHREVYREWALYRIPEVEECLHRPVDLTTEAEFVYLAGQSVMVRKGDTLVPRSPFRFPIARTRIDLLKEKFQAPLIDLHGKDAILEYIWKSTGVESSELTMDNTIWNAILSYYAGQDDPLRTYLSLGVTKVLVRGEGEEFGGLEGLYGEEFDLLKTEYEKGYKGIAGYYTTKTLKLAGIGILDVLYAELGDDFSGVVEEVLRSDNPSETLLTILTDRGIPEANTIVTEFEKYLNYLENYQKTLNPEASEEEVTQSAIDWLEKFAEKSFNLAQELKDYSEEQLTQYLQNAFGWSEESADNCLELTKEERPGAYFKIASVITSMEMQKYDINVLTRIKESWEKNFGSIYMFNPKNIWLLSAFATDILRERPQGNDLDDKIAKVAEKLAAMARGERLLTARAPDVRVNISNPFYSGLISSIAEGLSQPGYDITEAVDPAYLKYLEDNPNFFGEMEQALSQSQQLEKLIGKYDKNNPTHAGFIASLIYDVWKLMTDEERPLSQDDAVKSVLDRINLISKLFNAGSGDPDGGVFTAEELMKAVGAYEAGKTYTIEDVLKNPDAIGILSFYAKLITPITDSERDEILGSEGFENVKRALTALQRDRRLPGISITDEELAQMIVFWERYYGKEFEIPADLDTEKHNFATILFNYEALGPRAAEWYSPEIIKFLDNVSSLYRMYLWTQLLTEIPEEENDPDSLKRLNNRLRHLVFDMLNVSKQIEPQAAKLLGQDYVIRSDDRQAGFLSSMVESIYNQALKSALGVYNQAYVEALAQWLREEKGLDVVAKGTGVYERTIIPGHEEERWIGNTPEEAAQIADEQFAQWLIDHWDEASGMTDTQLHQVWQGFYNDALGGMGLVYVPPEEILKRITGHNYRRYISEFERNNPELIAQFIQQARENRVSAIESATLNTQAQILTASILKPLVEQSRFMVIDVLDPKQGGILWYYTGRAMRAVNPESIKDLADDEEKIAAIQKQIEASRTYDMIEILNKEIKARRILAQNGYNIDPFLNRFLEMGSSTPEPVSLPFLNCAIMVSSAWTSETTSSTICSYAL